MAQSKLQIKCGTCGGFLKPADFEKLATPEFDPFEDHPHKPDKVTVICPCGETLEMGPGVPNANFKAQFVEAMLFAKEHAACKEKQEKWAN